MQIQESKRSVPLVKKNGFGQELIICIHYILGTANLRILLDRWEER
jgi:hypothetical protein